MCYNKTYALKEPACGQIAQSRMGHDAGKPYIIAAVVGSEFVLCVNGTSRPMEKPKQKRVKHLKLVGESQEAEKLIGQNKLTDSAVRKILKEWANANNR